MAIKNIRQFNRWIDNTAKDLTEDQLLLFQKRVALEVFRRVIFKSPVGNPTLWANPNSAPPGYVGGRFRANWQINTTLTRETIDGTGDPTAVGISALNRVRQPYGTIWVFNNVPYAQRLEEGWSGQAPAGVVGVTLAEITQARL